MHFVFFGTDDFSVMILEELKKAGLLPALVVTVPDRPKGRGLRRAPPTVKAWAIQRNIPLFQPEELEIGNWKLEITPDLCIVASYGQILPAWLLAVPTYGTVNVHPSLLPKYRGATPIESQILNGEKEVGVTIMLMDERMDHGPILAQKALGMSVIPAKAGIRVPTALELKQMLARAGGVLLAEVMPKWIAGKIEAVPQDHTKATYTKKFTKADGEIDLNGDPYKNFLKIQAFEDSIGTYFHHADARRLKTQIHADTNSSHQRQSASKSASIRVLIKSADFRDGKLLITSVVPEGRKEMSYEEFLRGFSNGKK